MMAKQTHNPAELRHGAVHGAVYRRALSALAAALLAGCATGPEYAAPRFDMPAAYRQAAGPQKNGIGAQSAVSLDQWWTQFHDPLLTQVIERVRAQNLDIKIALARVEQARAIAQVAQANLLPKGDLSLQAAAQRQSLQSPIGEIAHNFPGYQRNTTLYDSGVGASWELDLSGGLKGARQSALADAQATEADRLAVQVMMEADAADAYFRIRGAQMRIELARQQIKTDADLLEVVDQRRNEGMATRQEQAEAQARLAQLRAAVPPLQHELDVQLNRLDVLMGAMPGTYADTIAPNTELPVGPLILPEPAGTLKPHDLLLRRPDVIAAERRLAASHAHVDVAMAQYYPQVSLSALLGFEGLDTAGLNRSTFQPGILAGLRWRLFDFGRVDAEVAQAKGANAEALIRYRAAMLKATEEVENALSTLNQLALQRKELKAEVEADIRARQAAEDAYKGGVTGMMELLEQDRQLLASRDQLAVAEADSARAAVATFRALGGGW
jgi:NodT family efflux transporter outer membrane factor (OMF) lipoprotein